MNVIKVNSTQSPNPPNPPNILKETLNIINVKNDIEYEHKFLENSIELIPMEQACFTIHIENQTKPIKTIFYSLICDDTHYHLNHYINKVDKSSFKICIVNTYDTPRKISISYLVFF